MTRPHPATKKPPPIIFARRFGENLQRARKRIGISQEELGVRAGLHRTAVGQLERGERVARSDTLVKLCGSIGATPQELLAGLEWNPGRYSLGAMSIADEASTFVEVPPRDHRSGEN